MIDTTNPHVALSDNAAKLIEHAASSVVSVHGGSRRRRHCLRHVR